MTDHLWLLRCHNNDTSTGWYIWNIMPQKIMIFFWNYFLLCILWVYLSILELFIINSHSKKLNTKCKLSYHERTNEYFWMKLSVYLYFNIQISNQMNNSIWARGKYINQYLYKVLWFFFLFFFPVPPNLFTLSAYNVRNVL